MKRLIITGQWSACYLNRHKFATEIAAYALRDDERFVSCSRHFGTN